MTIEEELAEAKKSIDAMTDKNRELLSELKKVKAKTRESVSVDEFSAVETERDDAKSELAKLKKQAARDAESSASAIKEKDAALSKYLIDSGLTSELAKAGVAAHFLDAAKAMLKAQASIDVVDGSYSAVINKKPLDVAVGEWAKSESGKHFVLAPNNAGGGAAGGTAGTTTANPFSSKSFNLTQQIEMLKTNPELAATLRKAAAGE